MENETDIMIMNTPAIDLNPQVDSLSSTSLGLSWTSPSSQPVTATYFNINCNSSSTLITDHLYLGRSHCISYMYLVENSTNRISVTGLMAGTNYTCCVETDVQNPENSTGCVHILTLKGSMSTGLSNAVVGVLGGMVGMTMLLMVLALAGVVVLAKLYIRKRRFSEAVSKPVERSHSKHYACAQGATMLQGNTDTNMDPEETAETSTQGLIPKPQKVEEGQIEEEKREREEKGWSQEQQQLEDIESIYASTSIPINPMPSGAREKSRDLNQELDTEQYECMLALKSSPVYRNLPHTMSQVMPDIYENCPRTPYTP